MERGVCEVPLIATGVINWADAATVLSASGWLRLRGAVDAGTRAALTDAAPPTWTPLPEIEQGVRQGGQSCGAFFNDAAVAVQEFGTKICVSLNVARRDLPPVPCFNEVQWGRSDDGVGFITTHRDPPGAGGVIAIVTLSGRALFRVWHGSNPTE